MNTLTTTQTSVTFTNAQGVTKTIVKNYIWYRINEDTVTFLVLPDADPGGDGTCFFASKIEDLTINGTVYTAETIVAALDDIFEPVNVSDVYTKEQIDEMLDDYAELTDLDQFIDATELAAALTDYQEKLTAGTGITIDANNVISATGGGSSITVDSTWVQNSTNPAESQLIQGALADKADKSNTYTKTETDNLLAGKVSTGTLATVASSGSYTDLTNTPTIPAAQVQSSWTESDTTSKAYILGKPTLAAVATTGAYSDLSGTPDLSTKQDTLVSGTNIKTVNGNSILGSGNIEISSGGTQVQSDWTEADSSSMAYILHKPNLAAVATSGSYADLSNTPTNVSTFTNDAGYLTQHQSLADVFGDVLYDSQTKHINFYGKGDTSHTTVLAYVDAANFIVDGMVDTVEVKNATVSGQTVLCLVISFNTDAGKQDINIPISQIFDATNYYTKSETDTLLSGKASTSSLATVATSGSYNDLSNKPTIPAAPAYYSEQTSQTLHSGTIDTKDNGAGASLVVSTNIANSGGYAKMENVTEADGLSSDVITSWVELNGGGVDIYTIREDENQDMISSAAITMLNDSIIMAVENGEGGDELNFGVDEWGNVQITSLNMRDTVAWASDLTGKQDTLVSGTNIKTINNESILGSGNITISGGSAQVQSDWNQSDSTAVDYIKNKPTIPVVDQTLNTQSNNAISNSAVATAIGDIETALQILNGTNSNS